MPKKKKENNREEDLQEVVDEIKQRFGEGSILKLKDVRSVNIESIPTGSFSLDLALGIGGIPKGRVVEIFGPEATGKSTLALHCIAEVQKRGESAAFIDAEHALDPDYAKRIGVNTDDLLISQPDSGEQALQIVESLVRSEALSLIVVDSVAALTPKVEIAGEIGDQHIGLQARLMSQALRKLAGIVSKTRTSVIFLNQTRMKIGIMFGNPETTPGGLALKFYSSVRIQLKLRAKIKHGDDIIGSRIKAKVVKNKVAAPFKSVEFDIYYNEGISKFSDIINVALKYDIIKRSGSWFQYGDKKLGQGMEGARQALKDDSKLAKEIKKEVMKKV